MSGLIADWQSQGHLSGTSTPSLLLEKSQTVIEVRSIGQDSDITNVPRHVVDILGDKGFDVDFEGVVTFKINSIAHPRNWSLSRKTYDFALICFLEMFMTLMSNTGSMVVHHAHTELGISRLLATFCITSTYLVGQASGGLIFAPVAECFGYRTIYVASTSLFAAACLLIAIAPGHLSAVVVGRLVSGLASAIPATIGVGSIENMWDEKGRITMLHAYISGAVLGLACGPAFATYISTSVLGWRWVFGISAIVTGISAAACWGMHESRHSKILRETVKNVARNTKFEGLTVESEHHLPTISEFVSTSVTLPVWLFCTEPVLFWCSIMSAIVYGNIYMFSEALTVVYHDVLGMSEQQTSLIYLAFGAGILPTVLPRLWDLRLVGRREREGTLMEPEDKLFAFYIAAPLLAFGLWWFALTTPPIMASHSPWASILSLVLIGYATVEFDSVLSGYLTDTYMSFASSAVAPVGFLRAMLSGVFPLFSHQMFRQLGSSHALFVLAGMATLFCFVAVWMKLSAKKLRLRSPFAAKTALSAQSLERVLSAPTIVVVDGQTLGVVGEAPITTTMAGGRTLHRPGFVRYDSNDSMA